MASQTHPALLASFSQSSVSRPIPMAMQGRLSRAFGLAEVVAAPKSFIRALVAEFVATAILLIVGIGSGLPSNNTTNSADLFQSSVGGGLTVVAAIQMSLAVSGAHLNPAVTLAMFAVGKAKTVRSIFYIFVQILAGLTAAWFLIIVQPNGDAGDLVAKPGHGLNNFQVFAVEFIATFALLMPACTIADKKAAPTKGTEPILMGLTIVACHLFALKYSGCGLNPARILGAAILSNKWENVWIYCCAEISGGVIASLIYFFAIAEPERSEVSSSRRPSDSMQIFPRTVYVRPDQSPKSSFLM